MPTLDEKLKNVLTEMQTENNKRIDEKISSIVMMGFILGVFFSYTNLLGLCTGFGLGVITSRKFGPETYSYTKNIINIFYGAMNIVRGYKIDN
jgi:hypothetical protein